MPPRKQPQEGCEVGRGAGASGSRSIAGPCSRAGIFSSAEETRRATIPSYASTWAPTTCTSTPIYTERPHARSSSRTAWLRTRTRLRTSLSVSRQCKSFRISEKALKTLESFPNRCIQRPLKSQSAGPGLGGAGVLLLLHSMSAPVKSQRPQRPASRSPGAHSSFAGRGTGTATCPWSSPSGWRL